MNAVSWWRTDFGEEEVQRIAQSIASENISQGPVTAAFEQRVAEILGIPYVVATTSGSMAILMALLAAGIGPGDEVIVPNRTWIATAHAPMVLGAKTVLTDVEPGRPILDVTQIEKKITGRTKAIIPVHLNGRSADMQAINGIASRYNVKVIEDAAQALCSRNADGMLGTQSFAGCFSLSVAKIISTGQGGFVVTRDAGTYERLNLLRTHGVRDVINATYAGMGFNFRFNDILASIGLVQLDRLPKRISRVKEIYARYEEAMRVNEFTFLRFLPVDVAAGEIPVYIEVLCPERTRLVQFLADHDIQTRPFYPDLDTAAYLGCSDEFPNSRIFGQQGLFLPCGPAQTLDTIEHVIDVLRMYQVGREEEDR